MKGEDVVAGALFRFPPDTEPALEILDVQLPGHQEYDGALPGVSFRWLGRRRGWMRGHKGYFWSCKSADEFANDERHVHMAPVVKAE